MNPDSRRSAREAALRVLFALDGSQQSANEALDLHFDHLAEEAGDDTLGPAARAFCETLVHGVEANRAAIDAALGQASTRWSLERMTRVDRNVLRLGAFELLFGSEVPRAVAISEAIELAREFGDDPSPKFVNGVLDALSATPPTPGGRG